MGLCECNADDAFEALWVGGIVSVCLYNALKKLASLLSCI